MHFLTLWLQKHSLTLLINIIFFPVNISWEYLHSVMFAYIFLSAIAILVAIFAGILEFYEEFWRKVDKKDTYNLSLCVLVGIYAKEIEELVNRVENLSGVFKKIHVKSLNFITQFKIEFLLPITGCRKVLGKMPVKVGLVWKESC